MKKQDIIILGIFLFLVFVVPSIHGQQIQTSSYCIDNITLNITETRCIDDICKPLSRSFGCPYGCDNVTIQCSPDKWNRTIWILIPVIVFFIIVIVMIMRWR